jgi:hypothetical protein
LPFSSVFSRDGAARRDPWETDREALVPDALVGVGGSGFTVMLERALSVLEPVMELKREPSFLPIVTRRSWAEQENQLLGHGHSTSGETGLCSGHFNDSGMRIAGLLMSVAARGAAVLSGVCSLSRLLLLRELIGLRCDGDVDCGNDDKESRRLL